MTAIQITCDNCGAKYRLPENFTGSTSKCQKCGSVIDVAKQRANATSAAGATASSAAKPAAGARPAVDRSREAQRPPERRPASPPPREVPKTGRTTTAGQADREKPRRGRGERTKKSAMPFVLGGVVVAIIVVVVLAKSAG